MILTVYEDMQTFFDNTRAYLEQEEAVNNLLLGLPLGFIKQPARLKVRPIQLSVEDKNGLVFVSFGTPPYSPIIYSHQEQPDEAMQLVIEHFQTLEEPIPGIFGHVPLVDHFAKKWHTVVGDQITITSRQRVYELRDVIPPHSVAGHLRLATEDDIELAVAWSDAFQREALHDDDLEAAKQRTINRILDRSLYLWEDNQPVSMAIHSRVTIHGATISYVYTPPELRGNGYASACVAALSQHLLDSGWQFCNLFTDLTNPTSNSIYQKIGYRAVRDMRRYGFEPL